MQLEWKQVTGGWIARFRGRSQYQIRRLGENSCRIVPGDFEWHLVRGIMSRSHGGEQTLEAAQAACQADCDRRFQRIADKSR